MLRLTLYVSGILQGSKDAIVNSLDRDASGRVAGVDFPFCDPTPPGQTDLTPLFQAHEEHGHRNALHGTLVRRIDYCETCPREDPGTKGASEIFWSPSGRFISHTQFVLSFSGDTACKVFIVPSGPNEGNALTQFTFAPDSAHDYDPSWSPLNDVIAFDRSDKTILRKPVPWSGSTSETEVTTSDNFRCGSFRGDTYPAISPNGQWVAFSRCNPLPPEGPGGWSLWKVPITGGAAQQLTPTLGRTDAYPSWSPDGQTIYFQPIDAAIGERWTLWKVPAAGGDAQPVFLPPMDPAVYHAVQPAASADGKIVVTGFGRRDDLVRTVFAHTLDPALVAPNPAKAVVNYADTTFGEKGSDPLLSPRLSPDGTRLALGTKQIWAARRNMNLPPRFGSVTSSGGGTQAVADTAARMDFTFSCQPGTVNTITVSATDPEGDPLTYLADFVPSGMSWDPDTRTLTHVATFSGVCPSGLTFYVLFRATTASGGTDALIGAITFPSGGLRSPGAASSATAAGAERDESNPSSGPLAVIAPGAEGGSAVLSIFDVAGRRIARVRGQTGSVLVWDGKYGGGTPAAGGICLWRLEAGPRRQEGKFVVVR